jgi:general secretion pathway protein J
MLVGAPEVCEMVTLLPASPGGGHAGPAAVRLEVDAAHRLVLRWVPAPHVIWFRPPPLQETVLLDRVERIEFAYWKEAAGGGGAWQRSWNDSAAPSLVRLRIVFPRGDPRRWPDIVAAPRLDRGASRLLLFPAGENANIAGGAMDFPAARPAA